MTKVTREQLVNAANELNDEFGLEPAIKVSKRVEDEVIEEGILKASEMYDPDNDELTPETIAVMDALKGDEEPEEEQTPPTLEKDAEAETEEAPELTKAQIEMLAELKVTKKMVDLAELLEDEMFDDVRDELTKENNPIKLKGAMKRSITGDIAPTVDKPPKKDKPAKKSSKSRIEVAAETIQKHDGETVTVDALIAEADEAYGKSNVDETKTQINKSLKVLAAIGLVEVKGINVTVTIAK